MNQEVDTNIKRMGFDLPEAIHRRVKIVAVAQGVTMQDWMQAALSEKLIRSEKEVEEAKKRGQGGQARS